MNKKIIFTVLAILVFAVAVCHAADRWQWIYSNNKIGTFFDTQTIKYDTDQNHFIVYIKYVLNDDGRAYFANTLKSDKMYEVEYCIVKEEYDLNNRQFKTFGEYYYRSDNTLLYKINYDAPKYMDIVPGTNTEKILEAIQPYLKNNAVIDKGK